MTKSNPRRRRSRLTPGAVLTVSLLLALLLLAAPPRWFAAPRELTLAALRPGLLAADSARRWTSDAFLWCGALSSDARQLTAARRRIRQLEGRNKQLETALKIQNPADVATSAAPNNALTPPPLLIADVVRARVIGQQAAALLLRYDLLDAGVADGAQLGSMVLHAPLSAIDQGADQSLRKGQFTLAGRTIWGRIAETGRHTSTVQRVTSPGYRDVVRLVQSGSDRGRRDRNGRGRGEGDYSVPGPRGLLKGTGGRFCRIGQIEVTEPVSVGDWVVSDSTAGLSDSPLWYGRVVEASRDPAASHWTIRMQPALDGRAVSEVLVLRASPNPKRTAQSDDRLAN